MSPIPPRFRALCSAAWRPIFSACAIVVPGTRPKEFPAGTYYLSCALIIGQRTESTDLKTSLNDALREYGIGT